MTFVIDASVAVRWFFADEENEQADFVFEQAHRTGAFAPALLVVELSNAFAMGMRRKRIEEPDVRRASAVFAALPIHLQPVAKDRVIGAVVELASRYELTVYDAMYLDLAITLNRPLATFDAALQRAATDAHVSLLLGDPRSRPAR